MADKGTTPFPGVEEQYVVVGLKPVKYSITLHYLGEKYVKRDDKTYRCRYELKKDAGDSLEGLPRVMPNVVSGETVEDEDSRNAATPGFAPVNPKDDEIYRILVTDNHTLPEVDVRLLGNTGSPNGDKVSRPEYYGKANRKWMKDVQPAVPFRVIVRKFQGESEQVDLDAKLQVVIEVKDPVEESPVHASGDDNTVDNFLNDFFIKYNRTDAVPSEGDDNCVEHFRGLRKPSDAKPGINACKVIRTAPYIAPPSPMIALPEALQFRQISKKGAYKTQLVKFDVKAVELEDNGKKVKIGIADFVFNPLPVGGDNYRFLITLTDGSGKDIRETRVSGADVAVMDDRKALIPRPRAYCTGRFVMWRRLDVRLMLTANMLAAGDIDWDKVKGYYRHTFTEVFGPAETRALPLAGWRQSIISVFNGGSATGAYGNMDNFRPAGKNPGDAEYNDIYRQGLFPAFMNPATRTSEDVKKVCRDILANAVKALPFPAGPGLAADKRNIEKEGEGIYMLYVKCNGGSLLGCWLGDGRLLVGQHTGAYAAEVSETTTHEMAHGLFLRHSNTSTQRRWDSANNRWVNFTVNYEKAGAPAAVDIQLVDPKSNCFPEDHDQQYSCKCTMSYLQEQHFCGVCALSLRFYDRVKVQDKARFQDRIMKGFFDDAADAANDAKIVYVEYSGAAPNDLKLKETIPNLANGGTMYLMSVGPEKQYIAAGSHEIGRVNLSCAGKPPSALWKSSNTGVATIKVIDPICVEIKGKKAGTSTITYSRNGNTATAVITVT